PHTDPGVPGAGGPARQVTDIPAQPPLSPRGFGVECKPGGCRPYAGQFQDETNELCRRENRQIGQVAQDVGLMATAVRARASQAEPDAGTGDDGTLTSADRRELAQLRRENRMLRQDVEILKRATAIFATATRETPTVHRRGDGGRRNAAPARAPPGRGSPSALASSGAAPPPS